MIPSWVRFITIDADGERRGHKNTPRKGKKGWYSRGTVFLIERLDPPKDWKKELYQTGER